ncbi:uncharacterized protein TNCT_321491 [Trichonephila clavata]|uniref:Uncharacterized protein n=1 Tax=Trichonephila clavata TaxID=2740835 RepID=A0A8X6HFD7_TRICU|nr:uncharacterized protein TNCT_321491 [Trichonephila clavata]
MPKPKASKLHQWNLLLPGVKITEYRTRERNLLHLFDKKEHVVACIGVNILMNFMNISYDRNNWRLFIDSFKLNLKAVLLPNGKLFPSISINNSVHMKKTYANIKLLLELIKFENHKWQIYHDLKVYLFSWECIYVIPSTDIFCVYGTVEIENHTKYKTNGRVEI